MAFIAKKQPKERLKIYCPSETLSKDSYGANDSYCSLLASPTEKQGEQLTN